MLTHVEVAILRDMSQSIAFADDRHGEVEQLIVEGYVMKAGDLYELTSKGLRAVEDHRLSPHAADQELARIAGLAQHPNRRFFKVLQGGGWE